MPRPTHNFTADMTPAVKRKLMASIGALTGLYEVKIEPKRETRSTRQNSYWWSCIVHPFFEFLRDQEPSVTEPEQAHIELKRQILGTRGLTIGNVTMRIVPASRTMTTEEFSDLVDRARAWLLESVGIETVDPDPAYYIARREKQSA